MQEWTLALGGSNHDASAALLYGDDIRVAIEEERLSRRKHGECYWFENPNQRAIDYCLSSEGISMRDVAHVVASDTIPTRVKYDFRHYPVREFGHHLCHAAAAYMMVPPNKKTGVIVYDGFGSERGAAVDGPLRKLRETISLYVFDSAIHNQIGGTLGLGLCETEEFPIGVNNSVGMLYELITACLGYDLMDSGKTMGLSSHGTPRYLGALEQFVSLSKDINQCFACATDNPSFQGTISRILSEGRDSFTTRADLAASLQLLTNRVLLHCGEFFQGSGISCLCISGGCGLNTVATAHLIEHTSLDVPVCIPPHCGDAGLGLGAAWLHEFERLGRPPQFTFRNQPISPGLCRPGRRYTAASCRAAAQEFYPRLAYDPSYNSPSRIAHFIAEGGIVGVLNGPSEIGPRALGGRSIIADPRKVLTRERINRTIKKREPFRPLAPIVLRSNYAKYFHDERMADEFMLKVSQVRERCTQEAPAVVHVDGTARVQVIPEDGDPLLVELLRSFEAETGVGLLINTSFNRRGEPIVETPHDAVDAFLGLGLDALYLGGEFYLPVTNNPTA